MDLDLDDTQRTRLDSWLKMQRALMCQVQGTHSPYYGAIGGEITYCFTPTSLGTILVVKHAGTGKEINLTDFNSW